MNPAHDSRSFELTDRVLAEFQKFSLEQTGIKIDDTKRAMITTRFSRRVRELRLDSFEEYLEVIKDPAHPERVEFINTITTNLTYFFREPHHFEFLKEKILPELQASVETSNPIRIWSAGCSSGPEPYSIAISANASECAGQRQVRILCTDIDSDMIEQTKKGIYKTSELRGLSDEDQKLWFDDKRDGYVRASAQLRNQLICRYLNLFSPWPIKPFLDVIFCRNVLIYFDVERQEQLIRGMGNIQKPGSTLIIGHSETIGQCTDIYRRIANTIYERI